LDNDWHVGLNNAGIVCVARNGGILKVVEPKMFGPSCRNRDAVRRVEG